MHHNDTPRTTEQNARERIDGILRSIEIEVWPEEGDIWLGDTNPAIDQLIGFIREAMLSPKAVNAGAQYLWGSAPGMVELQRPGYEQALHETLDAALGPVEPTAHIVDGDTGVFEHKITAKE